MLSFLLHGSSKEELTQSLDSIFGQGLLNDFEIVICDDATVDGAWEVASSAALQHDGLITINRNNIRLGSTKTRRKGQLLCRGNYTVELTGGSRLNPIYVTEIMSQMDGDPFVEHNYIYKTKRANQFLPLIDTTDTKEEGQFCDLPLVSIYIYNYNYGRYLDQCLKSAIAQTYRNIEICFSDNASDDDSWKIATAYAATCPGKISLTRNRINFGPATNLWNCELNRRGKYILKLCSDDAMRPDFIERCVSALEQHPNAAFALVHREIMDEAGQLSQEPPFYDQSCLIPGASQAAVYMMSAVNPSISQIVYNAAKIEGKRMIGNLNDRWHGDRLMDFHVCTEFDVIYLKDPLLLNRVHGDSDGSSIDNNLLQCFTQYVLAHQFADIASNVPHMNEVSSRLPAALEKIGKLCLRYCLRFLNKNEEICALRYFHLAQAISQKIISDPQFKLLEKYWSTTTSEKTKILIEMNSEPNLISRTNSYPPPKNSIKLTT